MPPRAREIELLLLTGFAAIPFYATHAVGILPVVLFHLGLLAIVLRVASGRTPELLPEPAMRALAAAYTLFFLIDAVAISRSAIAASTHLVLFIALLQPVESVRSNNYEQRLLVTALIFIAALATSTDITVVLFVIAFAFVMFRQMMYLSHRETERLTGHEYRDAPSWRAAAFYLAGTAFVAALLFPIVPRVRNPMVQGMAGSLTGATSGLSESIDFNQERATATDPTVVARVWMGPETIPFFTPLRLRGAVYDRYSNNKWLQTPVRTHDLPPRRGAFRIAQPHGFTRGARLQERFVRSSRLFLPSGTYAISGVTMVAEGPTRGTFFAAPVVREVVTLDVSMARGVAPIHREEIHTVDYPRSPEVDALARRIAGGETNPARQAGKIERYLLQNFRYLQSAQQIGRPMTTDEFLLRERRGHCEYFAAGMVALLSSLGVPARIAGGYYGGRFNPLTGYFVIRREDAHAWVEAWDGEKWVTFDPTPPTLRPGTVPENVLKMYATALGDSINYFWDRYVLTFGLADQIALAAEVISRVRQSLDGARSGTREALAQAARWGVRVFLFVAAIGTLGAIVFSRRRRPLFVLLARHLERFDIHVGAATTMEEALALLRARHPTAAAELEPLIALYEAERFSARRDRMRSREIRRKLRAMRVQTT
jgi:transglutaminase-like putative cysteine protease